MQPFSSLVFACRTTLVAVKPPWTLKDLLHLLDRCVGVRVCVCGCVLGIGHWQRKRCLILFRDCFLAHTNSRVGTGWLYSCLC